MKKRFYVVFLLTQCREVASLHYTRNSLASCERVSWATFWLAGGAYCFGKAFIFPEGEQGAIQLSNAFLGAGVAFCMVGGMLLRVSIPAPHRSFALENMRNLIEQKKMASLGQ